MTAHDSTYLHFNHLKGILCCRESGYLLFFAAKVDSCPRSTGLEQNNDQPVKTSKSAIIQATEAYRSLIHHTPRNDYVGRHHIQKPRLTGSCGEAMALRLSARPL
jgi:hypothetical protein